MGYFAIIVLAIVSILASRPFGPFSGHGGAGFAAVTHKQNTGTGNEIVPQGSASLTIEVWAAGAGGSVTHAGRGGSSGSYGKKTFTVIPGDWNKSIPWVVGNKGLHCFGTACSGTDGTNSTAGGVVTLNGVTINIVTNHGLATGAAPAAGTGGSTNTAGNAQISGVGGSAVTGDDGDSAGDGGDGEQDISTDPPTASSDGSNGMVKFKWQ